jgi:N-acetylglutamate synthase-like GNAT family acetyltransferase
VQDVGGIVFVLQANRGDPSLFQRSESDVRRHVHDFVVAKDRHGRILGCAALHRYDRTWAEVLTVAVLPEAQGKRIGERLIHDRIRCARAGGVPRLWLGTMKPGSFARFGFQPISRWELPLSVLWSKVGQIFRQHREQWLRALVGHYTVMQLKLEPGETW